MNYENDFIKIVRLDDSNRHSNTNYNKFEKMWSIIYKSKKTFNHLQTYKNLEDNLGVYISYVAIGVNKGCYGIRIPNMKQCPTLEIAVAILDYIFK